MQNKSSSPHEEKSKLGTDANLMKVCIPGSKKGVHPGLST